MDLYSFVESNPAQTLRLLDKIDAESSLADFTRIGWPAIDTKDFVTNWHIDAIAEHLEAVTRGDIRRLIVNIPPRHMKSIGAAVAWPAWTWIQSRGTWGSPKTQFLFSSYAQQLSTRDSVKCRRLVQSPWYQQNWGHVFSLQGDQNQKTYFENNHGGYRMATSVEAGTTGYGGDIVVVDDPHNVREGESETTREGVLMWWDEAMSTRLNDQKRGAYVIVMQRVHYKDLVGHILAKETGWDHLCLPAEFEHKPLHPVVSSIGFKDPRTEEGELLWPEKIGPEDIERMKITLGTYGYSGQYQQRPSPREGGMFQRSWFKVVDRAPHDAVCVRAWDFAGSETKKSAYTCGVRMSYAHGRFYIEHVKRFRGTPGVVEDTFKAVTMQDGMDVHADIPQDPGQAGKFQARHLVKTLPGYVVRFSPETGSKETRALGLSAQAEAGNVYLVRGDWNSAFLDEIEHFPMGEYKDQVDASTRAFHRLLLRANLYSGDIGAPVSVDNSMNATQHHGERVAVVSNISPYAPRG